MRHPLRAQTIVAGIGNTRRWNAPGRTPFDQLQEAAILALEDCGLSLKDVDGLFCALSITGLPILNVAERLGVNLRYADGTMVGGASFLFQLQSAVSALAHGLCDVALICYGRPIATCRGIAGGGSDPRLRCGRGL